MPGSDSRQSLADKRQVLGLLQEWLTNGEGGLVEEEEGWWWGRRAGAGGGGLVVEEEGWWWEMSDEGWLIEVG